MSAIRKLKAIIGQIQIVAAGSSSYLQSTSDKRRKAVCEIAIHACNLAIGLEDGGETNNSLTQEIIKSWEENK